ncbi:MAG: DUF3347 domain-containing protein [Parafilimonas sp.]
MNKGLIIIGAAAIVIAIYFLLYNKKSDSETLSVEQQTLSKGKNSDAFNQPFNGALNKYFTVEDALVNWDTIAANKAATELSATLSNVPYDELKINSDSINKAKNLSESAAAEAKGLIAENTIESKRRSFYTLSEAMYNLLKTVHYDQQVIYHQKCPMAFNENEEGWWISNSSNIVNPYLGNKHPKYHGAMISCGNVGDSIDFRND